MIIQLVSFVNLQVFRRNALIDRQLHFSWQNNFLICVYGSNKGRLTEGLNIMKYTVNKCYMCISQNKKQITHLL